MSSERLDLSLPLCPRVWCLGRTWQPRRVWSTPVLSILTLSVLNTALLQQHFSDGASAHTSASHSSVIAWQWSVTDVQFAREYLFVVCYLNISVCIVLWHNAIKLLERNMRV